MSHREVFTKIAKTYLIPRYRRTNEQRVLCKFGLCHALDIIEPSIVCLLSLFDPTPAGDYYWYPCTPESDEYRAMSALLIAEIGKREFDRLLKEVSND